MGEPLRIATARLDLVAATLAHVEAELESPDRLAALLEAEIPEDWPPGEYDRAAMEFFRDRLRESAGAAAGWYGWYAVRRASPGQAAALVGAGGFLGPPSDDGSVELGYSVAAAHRGRGYATEMSRALVGRALRTAGVRRVVAHTSLDNPASIAVLERCGFQAASPPDPETGRLRFERAGTAIRLRLATAEDVPALERLIPISARALSEGFYSPEQTESAIRHVFGPDSRLIADGTYFVAESDEGLVGCGGWSRRRTLYGGDQTKTGDEPLLDPATEAARVRAFFVHPAFARRGIGSSILRACMDGARAAGFGRMELAATLPGIPLYEVFGFQAREHLEVPMPGGIGLPIVRMERRIDEP